MAKSATFGPAQPTGIRSGSAARSWAQTVHTDPRDHVLGPLSGTRAASTVRPTSAATSGHP